jgi:hypothetical protein
MKAVIWTNFGLPAVLQLQEVATPSPGQSQREIGCFFHSAAGENNSSSGWLDIRLARVLYTGLLLYKKPLSEGLESHFWRAVAGAKRIPQKGKGRGICCSLVVTLPMRLAPPA